MSSFKDKQVMVTMAALAYVAPIAVDNSKPVVSHTVSEEEEHMLGELTTALADTALATQGEWSVKWLGLSASQGELSFVAEHDGEDKLVVAVRGTVFGPTLDAICSDLQDDLEVDSLADFVVGDDTVHISTGASLAFAALTQATFDVPGHALTHKTLLEAVKTLVGERSMTIYVTGHSLGGCASTMLALYLNDALPNCTFQIHTFAAPTAGQKDFAALFDGTFGGDDVGVNSSWRFHNAWDVIPNAWQTLGDVGGFYPNVGPRMPADILALFVGLIALPTGTYTQPKVNSVPLNMAPYGSSDSLWDHTSTTSDDAGFGGQVFFQHSVVNAYMPLLGLSPLPTPPAAPAAAAGATTITLAEPGFVHHVALQPVNAT